MKKGRVFRLDGRQPAAAAAGRGDAGAMGENTLFSHLDSKMTDSIMAREIAEIPEVVERQIERGLPAYLEAGAALHRRSPAGLITCARGTSDHAATYCKYLFEIRAGIPVASVGPSVASIYRSDLRLAGMACLTISQSGGSPDLVAMQQRARDAGAHTIAMLNVEDSPVGGSAAEVLPLLAESERAVAATKTFVASLFAGAALVAGFTGDRALAEALRRLPELLRRSLEASWPELPLHRAGALYTISRGPTLAAAAEAALKIKETCRLHAEAYSAAEVLHGPIALAGPKLGALCFAPADQAADSVAAAVDRLRQAQAAATVIGCADSADIRLPAPADDALGAMLQIAAFYTFIERLAVSLGENPDTPPGLRKVTETV